MRGLLVKDILILAKQKKLFIIYLASAVMLSFAMDTSFVVSYFSMIGALLVLTTISYDTFDNGLPFLMSLPVDAKTYAKEKFAFALIGLSTSWAAGVAAQLFSLVLQKKSFDLMDLVSMDLAFLPVFLLIISIMIPINLKFGSEKGRIIMIVLIALGIGIAFLGKKLLSILIKNPNVTDVEYLISKFASIPQSVIVLVAFGISLLSFFICLLISIRIMAKKEF